MKCCCVVPRKVRIPGATYIIGLMPNLFAMRTDRAALVLTLVLALILALVLVLVLASSSSSHCEYSCVSYVERLKSRYAVFEETNTIDWHSV